MSREDKGRSWGWSTDSSWQECCGCQIRRGGFFYLFWKWWADWHGQTAWDSFSSRTAQYLEQSGPPLCLHFLNTVIVWCKSENSMEKKRGPRNELFLEENPRPLLLQFFLRGCHICADVPILLLLSVVSSSWLMMRYQQGASWSEATLHTHL